MAPAIVLLHGFTHTGASWRPVVAALGERYRAIAPDIRGHGSAGAERPIDFRSCVADVAALAPERFGLAGYSMGARLALHVALAHPGRVERLALIGVTAGIEDASERRARCEADAALAAEMEQLDIETLAARWATTPVLAGQAPDVARAADQDRRRNQPAGLAAALRGIGTGAMEPLWDRLGDLAMPVTLVVGERDSKFHAIAARMRPLMPAAQLVVVQGAGHAAHLERPGAVAALL